MTVTRVLTDVTDDRVDQVVNDFKSVGCTVTKERQDNGKWTVTAICPS